MASPETITPAQLREMRPDLAAMPAPEPVPTAVDAQAEAHASAPDARPFFTYAGLRFPLKHVPDAFDLADLAEYMDQAEAAPIAALGGINRFLRLWVADYDKLRQSFRTELAGKDLDAQMLAYGELAGQLFEATTARPTEAPASSSDGRGPTTTSSKDASPSAAGSPSTAPSGSVTSTPG